MSRAPLLAAGIGSLIYGVALGLLRLGWALPVPHEDHLEWHGPLMIGGFLGIVIGLERAVALARPWAFAAPVLAAAGFGFLVGVPAHAAGPVLTTLASAALTSVYGVALRRQRSLFLGTMAAGGAFWLIGNLLWLAGWPVFRLVFWWMGFPVLTIAGERLELTRVLPATRFGRIAFLAVVGVLLAGTIVSSRAPSPPHTVGLGLLALALWLVRYDVARRTIRLSDLTRFVAASLLSGYVWLGLAGALALAGRGPFEGPIYDAVLHAVFVGFVFSMIFGHAPIIFPAILGGVSVFHPRFYGHLVALHLAMLLRISGDLDLAWGDGAWGAARAWGGLATAAAILFFMVNTVMSLRLRRGESAAYGA
jgi:hypothetical protein